MFPYFVALRKAPFCARLFAQPHAWSASGNTWNRSIDKNDAGPFQHNFDFCEVPCAHVRHALGALGPLNCAVAKSGSVGKLASRPTQGGARHAYLPPRYQDLFPVENFFNATCT
jgi:hypothetical protein